MKARRFILDSTLRDGEQMAGICFTGEQKVKIAALLDEGGVHQIEAGIPAASKQEKEIITRIMENRKRAVISVWGRLVPSDIQHAADCKPDIIHISIPISDIHIYSKLKKDRGWVISRLYACLSLIEKYNIPLSVGFEDAFRGDTSFMRSIAKILLNFGVLRIRLSDTVGIATPSIVRSVYAELSSYVQGRADFGFHAHNDLGMAVANTVEAEKCGCLYADVTAGGIGERAGNCDLAQLVAASSNVFDWGITPAAALKLEDDIFSIISQR
jgi:homocitrate synthase NifV